MKVLFAIMDDNNIVESLVRKYQKDYNKKLNYKEVRSYIGLKRELQENHDYDRIIISHDFDARINKSENKKENILKKLTEVVSIAKNKSGRKIPIIYISNNKAMLNSLYELKIFNGISGKEKIKSNIYELIKKPRNMQEAKEYYEMKSIPTKKAKDAKVAIVKAKVEDTIIEETKRGRPRKEVVDPEIKETPKRGRGRPRKNIEDEDIKDEVVKVVNKKKDKKDSSQKTNKKIARGKQRTGSSDKNIKKRK